jgi:hypothetical protein
MKSFTISDKRIMRDIICNSGSDAYALYMTLLSHKNLTDGKCYPSISTLSKEMNLKERTIYRILTKLTAGKYLIINSGNKDYNNNYYFPLEKNGVNDKYGQSKATRRIGGFEEKEIKPEMTYSILDDDLPF